MLSSSAFSHFQPPLIKYNNYGVHILKYYINSIIITNIQTSRAVRNSGISLADASALMAYNERFSCVNDFPATFPTFNGLLTVT